MFAAVSTAINNISSLNAISFKDIIDILIVAFFIYSALILIKRTRSFFVFSSALVLLIIGYLSQTFNLSLTRQLLQPLFTFFVVIFVVVYQREIRRIFDQFSLSSRNLNFLKKLSITGEVSSTLTKALVTMAENRVGAIIVLPGEYPLEPLVDGGFPLEGKVSTPLLLSIFDEHSPGHDGAVLIKDNQIKKFGLHLPLAENYTHFSDRGTRHRAAAGITEHTDAMAIVVSEERGSISISERGQLRIISGADELQSIISVFLKENIEQKSVFKNSLHYFIIDNFFTKISALAIAAVLWFVFAFQTGYVTRAFTVPIEFKSVSAGSIVTDISPAEIAVSLLGKTSDMANLDPRQLRATIDLTGLGEGDKDIPLSKSNLSFPQYVQLIDLSPKSVEVTINHMEATNTIVPSDLASTTATTTATSTSKSSSKK